MMNRIRGTEIVKELDGTSPVSWPYLMTMMFVEKFEKFMFRVFANEPNIPGENRKNAKSGDGETR